jgi:hypothetical protein
MAGLLLSRGYVWKVFPGKSTGANVVLQNVFSAGKNDSVPTGTCSSDIVLITGMLMERSGLVAPVEGVDSTRVLYVFGEKFGEVRITVTIFPGGDKYESREPKHMLNNWEQNSVLKKDTPINISWAGVEMKVYLTNVHLEAHDPETGAITAVLNAVIAPVVNKNA